MIFGFFSKLHNRRPLLWTVIAFIIAAITATILAIWWNVLLVENHRILKQVAAAATAADHDPNNARITFVFFMTLGILCSIMVVFGLLYMFLRLLKTVQLNLAQSQFIAAVTHELRSPVASLQLMLDTLRDPTTPEEKRREFQACMQDDLRRLRGLVDQVLETARLENFVLDSSPEVLEVKSLVAACIERMSTPTKTTGSTLTVQDIPASLLVRANRQLLMSTIVNVLDNALKYSTGPADVMLTVRAEKSRVALDIRDKGIGIAGREQKRVFRRFYRSEDPVIRSRPGTGLGLYFARLALKAQGGNISVESPGLGMGSTFHIEVPRA